MTSVGLEGSVLEHLLVALRANAHVFLTQGMDMGVDVVGLLG